MPCKLHGMTKYCCLIHHLDGRDEAYVSKQFDSSTLRAIYIIALPLNVEIVREWEE